MNAAVQARHYGRRRATILIVDDNVSLATCLEMLLEAHGHEVWRTADGTGGLESIRLRDFDVILCDLVMPGLSGDLFHAAVDLVKPHLCDRFIFMSGHPDKLPADVAEFCLRRPILRKPFAVQQLLETIETVVRSNSNKPAPPAVATHAR